MSQPSPMRARQDSRPVFPACLLLEGKPCLVVGGGKIALRKTRLLLEAAAQVRVVASDACAELRELAAQGQITQEARPFADADVEGAAVVFAATNDRAVNARVLELCERRGVLSCAVDKGWVNGNFLTPATYRKDELTIAISSGGQSCRRSRLIKDSLARHVAVLESAELLVLGTSHDYLSIQERSAYHLTERRLEEAGAMIMQVWGVHEFMLLNTCNRVELIAVVSSQPGVEPLLRRILKFDQLPEEGYYLKRGFDAFSHSAFAIAGLLSQTPGENHITAQFKEAASLAAARGWAGSLIEEWLAAALHISKHIRTQVAPLLQVEEIEELCIQYLRAQRGELRNLRAVVIGSGVIGAACVRLLVEQEGCECDWFWHSRAPEPAAAWDGKVQLFNLNQLRERLPAADLVVCATASSGHVLHQGHVPFFDQEKCVSVVDLAVPRNVAPELAQVSNDLRIADMDDLKRWHRRQRVDMVAVHEASRAVVEEHKDFYDKLLYHFQGGNTP